MTMHLHHLIGCAPTPLAFYLKALGVLRIVGEQADANVRGWWQDEHFCLLSALDADSLSEFLLEKYAPTPFVSPWNRGSGFYAAADPALLGIARSTAARFAAFRHGIEAARKPLAEMQEADAKVRDLKNRTKAHRGASAVEKRAAAALKNDPEFKAELAAAERSFKALKADLFRPCRASWRGPHRDWMDAALVVLDGGRVSWPSLLGTGGADGRLDFTNNAMSRLGQLFHLESPDGGPRANSRELLHNSLYSQRSAGLEADAAIGQFLPGSAGGANSTTAPDGTSLINPWDFVLMLEGAVLFSGRATRRLDPSSTNHAAAPFAVRAHTAGYASSGREKSQRGEQWMPLWSSPTALCDLRATLGEARLQLGRQTAYRPLDVARALARLGAARGVTGFTRFGYLERNGQSTLAVPLGRIEVRERPRGRIVDDLMKWLDRLQASARQSEAPARLVIAERGLSDAVFAVLTHDDEPARWQQVLLAAAEVESMQAGGTAFEAGPIPSLSPEWVVAADDGTAEWRLACALGSAAAAYDRWQRPLDPVRYHWLPLDPGAVRFSQREKRLVRSVRVVMSGREPVADFGAIVLRRLVQAEMSAWRHLPLVAISGLEAEPEDVARFIGGELDDFRLSRLARALMAVRWRAWSARPVPPRRSRLHPDEPWLAVRLACLPWPLDAGISIPTDQAIVRRLLAGDAAAGVELALRRLRSAGLRPPLRAACADAVVARRWAAALTFPISHRSARILAKGFEPSN